MNDLSVEVLCLLLLSLIIVPLNSYQTININVLGNKSNKLKKKITLFYMSDLAAQKVEKTA